MDQDRTMLLAAAASGPSIFQEDDTSQLEHFLLDDSGDEDDLAPAAPRKLPKSRQYFNIVEEMCEDEFRSHFRMGFDSFKEVTSCVEEFREFSSAQGLGAKKYTLVALWHLANKTGYRLLSQQFGISVSTAHQCVDDLLEALTRKMSNYIELPTALEEMEQTVKEFSTYGYPNVYGAIDGTSIDVTVPAALKNDYFTRKYRTSINLMALCDAKKRFISVTIGFSGRVHDSHIFQCSKLGQKILRDGVIPPQYHIIGDAAYGLHSNIMVPYEGQNLSATKQLHNNRHSSTRMVVERAFGDLKSRWLKLKSLECDIDHAKKVIASCCVLHNICVNNGDVYQATIANDGLGYQHLRFSSPAEKRDAITTTL